jgi:hypothetical protein
LSGPGGTDKLRTVWHAYGHDGEPDPEFLRRMGPPENELPVAMPQNLLLARTDDVAASLTRLQVYTTGLSFDLVVRVRPSAPETLGHSLNDIFWAHGPEGAQFLLGVEFADGRRASSMPRAGTDDQIVFHAGGGSGGQSSIEQSWWLSPVPPAGPLRLVLRCPDIGLAETVVELDGTAISRAVDDVVTLWPWELPRDQGPQPPPRPPDLPDNSWFAGSS